MAELYTFLSGIAILIFAAWYIYTQHKDSLQATNTVIELGTELELYVPMQDAPKSFTVTGLELVSSVNSVPKMVIELEETSMYNLKERYNGSTDTES